MSIFGCDCRSNCTGLAAVASIILGIIAAGLRYMGIITVTPAFAWTVFGIAVVYLLVALTTFIIKDNIPRCICASLPTFLAGILGTVLTAVILLAIPFEATSIIGAIITGALVLFFSLIITVSACIVKCAAGCGDDE